MNRYRLTILLLIIKAAFVFECQRLWDATKASIRKPTKNWIHIIIIYVVNRIIYGNILLLLFSQLRVHILFMRTSQRIRFVVFANTSSGCIYFWVVLFSHSLREKNSTLWTRECFLWIKSTGKKKTNKPSKKHNACSEFGIVCGPGVAIANTVTIRREWIIFHYKIYIILSHFRPRGKSVTRRVIALGGEYTIPSYIIYYYIHSYNMFGFSLTPSLLAPVYRLPAPRQPFTTHL